MENEQKQGVEIPKEGTAINHPVEATKPSEEVEETNDESVNQTDDQSKDGQSDEGQDQVKDQDGNIIAGTDEATTAKNGDGEQTNDQSQSGDQSSSEGEGQGQDDQVGDENNKASA